MNAFEDLDRSLIYNYIDSKKNECYSITVVFATPNLIKFFFKPKYPLSDLFKTEVFYLYQSYFDKIIYIHSEKLNEDIYNSESLLDCLIYFNKYFFD